MSKKQKRVPNDSYKRKQRITTSLEVFTILLALAVSMLVPRLFPDTEADRIISSTIAKFFDIGTLIVDNYLRFLETLAVIFFIWALNKVISWSFSLFLSRKASNSSTMTLLKSIIKYALVFVGIIFVLQAWGVDSSTLLVSVGLLGFVISFGAQGLIEDFLAGILIIMEGQYQVDDIVYLDGFRGRVLEVNLRTSKFLDLGNLDVKYINNRDIKNIINASQRNSVAICDVGIEYQEDYQKVEKLLQDFLPTLLQKNPKIIEAPRLLGLQTLDDSAVVIRIIATTKEDFKFEIQRYLNREIKLFFDANHINIPFPQVTISKLNE